MRSLESARPTDRVAAGPHRRDQSRGARGAWLVLGLMAGTSCAVLVSPWLLWAWVLPDLGVLLGGLNVLDESGGLTRAGAMGYNSTHSLVGPLVLSGVAALVGGPWVWGLVSLWICHIGLDRALGYTLKSVPARG